MNDMERIYLEIIHLLAKKFKGHLVLKGGMLLRLLNSARFTRDIDYVFITKVSRKVIMKEIEELISKSEVAEIISYQLNSRGIFIQLCEKGKKENKFKLEISMASSLHLPSEPFSTLPLAQQFSIPPCIIRVMALAESFSNKIAASLERNVVRDLYDISLYEPLTHFDESTLRDRLNQLVIRRAKPIKISFQEASHMLEEKKEGLNEEKLEQELFPLIPEHQQKGLLLIIRSSVSRVIQRLNTYE